MATSESDLKEQLADLDWGTKAEVAPQVLATAEPEGNTLDSLDVGVPGVSTPAPKAARARGGRKTVARQPKAQELLDAVTDGQTVASVAPGKRRPRTAVPDVLIAAGETLAVQKLFDQMWKTTGSKLARSIGRPKASRQDAAIGWYMLMLAMRERDAAK